MQIEIAVDADAVARRGAEFIAAEAYAAVRTRGRFTLAVSGGHTPWQMLGVLAGLSMPWDAVHLFQVDERVAPSGDADRNLTHIFECLLSRIKLPAANVHAMPVNDADLAAAAARYAGELSQIAGTPSVLDVVHLGLGPDGHTASLVPGDPALEVVKADVTLAGPYQGRRRMTLTYPMLNRARQILWVATGVDKVEMLARLKAGDTSIPAGRVSGASALILSDRAASGEL